MHEATASCKDIIRAPITNWEPHGVLLTGYCYAMRHRVKVQLITLYHVSHLQSYGVRVRGNITSLYPPLQLASVVHVASSPFCITLHILAECNGITHNNFHQLFE